MPTTTTTDPEAALAEARGKHQAAREKLEAEQAREAEAIRAGDLTFDFAEHQDRVRAVEAEIAVHERRVRAAEAAAEAQARARAQERCDELRGQVDEAAGDWHQEVERVDPGLAELVDEVFPAIADAAERHHLAWSALRRICEVHGFGKPTVGRLPALEAVETIRQAAAAWRQEQERLNR